MKPLEIESWALRALERVENRQRVEDSRVELKSEWPTDIKKTARQLAGHANSARGDRILWIIGIDEAKATINGASYEDLAKWFPQVQSEFQGIAPSLMDININRFGKTVVALCFDTSRYPYVVKNPMFNQPSGGPVEFEVPWREGARTRTATHNDLVLMLGPQIKMPRTELLAGELRFIEANPYTGDSHLQLSAVVYVAMPDGGPLVFPFHRCSSTVAIAGKVMSSLFTVWLSTPKARQQKNQAKKDGGPVFPVPRIIHETIETTNDEIIIRGSGKMLIEGRVDLPEALIGDWPEVHVSITATEAVSESHLTFNDLNFVRPDKHIKLWVLNLQRSLDQ